ncbi:MAG: mobile mystery protein B [Flavobacteriales bacterium]|nr:mobile mystery protein B [Flavobacteriales bacterium]
MGLNWEFTGGETELDPDELNGLLIPLIATRADLDEYEQANIQKARIGLARRRITPNLLLSETFIKRLHKMMYADVWKWAGTFRKTEKNIGVDPVHIAVDLRQLLDDARYQLEHDTFSPDEFAIRLKHRLVSIHCFVNGNGRHARLFAELLIKSLGAEPFTWGAFSEIPDVREIYFTALRKADRGDVKPLMVFARS